MADETREELEAALVRARADLRSNVQETQFADRRVRYRTGSEAMQRVEEIERKLANLTRTRSKQTRIVASKGW